MNETTHTAVRVDQAVKKYALPDGSCVFAANGVSFDVCLGDWVYLIGPNGSGKSTVLRMIYGSITPDEGSAWVAPELEGTVQYVEQGILSNLVPSMTVLENMLLVRETKTKRLPSLHLFKQSSRMEKIRASLALFGMGLEGRLNERVSHLSGGQQQAIVAARVLSASPRLLLLDEFTSALDFKVSKQVLNVIQKYAKDNQVTVISVTHDLHQLEAMKGKVVVLDEGRVKTSLDLNAQAVSAREIAEVVYG